MSRLHLAGIAAVAVILVLQVAAPAAAAPEGDAGLLYLVVPPEFNRGEVYAVVVGVAPFNVTIDYNANGVVDGDETTISVDGPGLRVLRFRVDGYGLVPLIVEGGPVDALLLFRSIGEGLAASYRAPGWGTVLYAPPIGGMVALASTRPAEVVVGEERLVVEPGEVVYACKPSGVTRIEANDTITGIFYVVDWARGVAAATELLGWESSVRVIALSSLQVSLPGARPETHAFIVGADGGYESIRLERLARGLVLDNDSIVFYLVDYGDALALAPAYGRGPAGTARGSFLRLGGEGFLLPEYRLILDSLPHGYAVLLDIDGDSRFEAPFFDFGTFPVWVDAGVGGAAAYVRGAPVTVLEWAKGMAALYHLAPPNPYNTTDLSLRDALDNEYVNVSVEPAAGGVVAYLEIAPRPGAGGVTNAIAAVVTPSLQPVTGTAVRLQSTGTTLYGAVPAPSDAFNYGSYLYALIVYQYGVSVISVPLINATIVVNASTPQLEPWCAPPSSPRTGGAVNVSLEAIGVMQEAGIADVDIVDLASVFEAAVGEPPVVIPGENTTGPPAPGPEPGQPIEAPGGAQERPSPAWIAALTAPVALIVILVVLRQARKS